MLVPCSGHEVTPFQAQKRSLVKHFDDHLREVVVVLTWRFHEVRIVAPVQTPLHPCRSSYAALSSHQRVHHGEEVVNMAAHDPHEVGDSGQGVSLLLKHGRCFMRGRLSRRGSPLFVPSAEKKSRSKYASWNVFVKLLKC